MTPRRVYDEPPLWKVALEFRAPAERAQMALLGPALRRLPRGDGHAVVVLPGFGAGDQSTSPLRDLLRDLGYRTYGWGSGANIGPTPQILEGLVRRLDRAYQRLDAPVSLIGWSLGGMYARELGRAFPDQVRQIVTLGTPIQMIEADRSSASAMWERLRGYHATGFAPSVRDANRPALTVPNTSIYTKTDGIVAWPTSCVERTENAENIRVFGSHCGLGFNPAAIYAVADRLAQPAGEWSHFRAPWWLLGSFPPADDLDPARLPPDAA